MSVSEALKEWPVKQLNSVSCSHPASSLPSLCHCVQVSDSFPYEWIKKKWREGFFVTAMATSSQQWAVVMSRTSGYLDQAVSVG